MEQEWLRIISDPFLHFWSRLVAVLPAIVAALLLLLVGFILARVARALVEKFLGVIKLDEHTGKIGFNEVLSRVGCGESPSYVMGFLIYWLIVLVFLVSASNVVQLTVVSELLEIFVLFIPKLIASMVILFAGLVLGHLAFQMVSSAAAANSIEGAKILGRVSNIVVVVFASIMAIEHLGIDTQILSSSLQIILGTIGLAVALAFGLGGRDVAADVIRDFLKNKKG